MPLSWLLRKQVAYALILLLASVSLQLETALAREIIGVYIDELAPPPVVAGVAVTPSPAVGPEINGGGERYAGLRQSIEAVLAEVNGTWGIGVQDLSTGDTLLINADRAYEAASQYKLLLLYEAYKRIAAGTLELDQMTRMIEADYAESLMWDEELQVGDRVAVRGLIRVLVIQSSNAAAHALSRVMGVGPGAIDAAAQQLSMGQTRMRPGGAMTSVPDLMRFYGMLYRGELVSKEASEAMMAVLEDQQINDRIPALLPRGVKVAHKTGNLPGVVNDAGVIFGPGRDVILVVLNDGADYEPGTTALAKIGQIVYNSHNR